MSKVVKNLLKVAIAIVAVVVVALLTLPLWFGPVVKGVANSVVPGVVKTDFRMGHLSLNPYTARFELGDTQLANPKGYSEKFAVTVGEVVFDADTASLVSDVIHVEEIKIKSIFVSYVSGGENDVNNFKQIQYNVAGGKEKYEAAQSAKEAKEATGKETAEQKEGEEKKTRKRILIDRLEVSDLVIQLGILPIRIPSFTLTDIGKDTGGSTFEDAWKQILEGVLNAAGALGDQIKALGGFAGDAAAQAVEAAGNAAAQAQALVGDAANAAGAAASQVTGAVGDAAGKATEVVGDGAKAATDAVGAGAKAAGEAVSGAAGAATDAVGAGAKAAGEVVGGAAGAATDAVGAGAKAATDAAGKAADAVGEGAKKALDSIKNLW